MKRRNGKERLLHHTGCITRQRALLRDGGFVAGLRVFLCFVVALLPFLSAPAQAGFDAASQETSHHVHMSHEHEGHYMQNGRERGVRPVAHDMSDHEACCETSDVCTHEQCTMSSFQVFGVMKSADTGIVHSLKMAWSHDVIAQRDGHRPLLDPPIP